MPRQQGCHGGWGQRKQCAESAVVYWQLCSGFHACFMPSRSSTWELSHASAALDQTVGARELGFGRVLPCRPTAVCVCAIAVPSFGQSRLHFTSESLGPSMGPLASLPLRRASPP